MTRLIRITNREQSRNEMAASIDYDDGEPATIVPALSGHDGAFERTVSTSDSSVGRTALAATPRDAAVDYDDGDPATIVA